MLLLRSQLSFITTLWFSLYSSLNFFKFHKSCFKLNFNPWERKFLMTSEKSKILRRTWSTAAAASFSQYCCSASEGLAQDMNIFTSTSGEPLNSLQKLSTAELISVNCGAFSMKKHISLWGKIAGLGCKCLLSMQGVVCCTFKIISCDFCYSGYLSGSS